CAISGGNYGFAYW
nr:immunoglobulin heavy chain junction region [Mus musculus]